MLVSIMGDSISTFDGYNPEGYAVFYDRLNQCRLGMNHVHDTWWAKTNQFLHAQLCVNNSYSGSKVSGKDFPAASSERRVESLQDGQRSPDVILVYMGFNDFGYGVQVSRRGLRRFWSRDTAYFLDAYDEMLRKIKRRYPRARIVCATIMRTVLQDDDEWIFPESFYGVRLEDINGAIRRACRRRRCYLADLSALNMRYETLDGTHPTAAGHNTIYTAWAKCLAEFDFVK